MAKQKKSRKNKQYTSNNHTKKKIDEMLPPGHRFDKEIADTCSNILLRVQMRRLDQPTSVERELRKEIKSIVASKTLSRISTNFFDSIIDICSKNPFVRAATRLLNATYNEYVIVEAYMATLTDISMKQRISNLISELNASKWRIKLLREEKEDMSIIHEDNFIGINEDWESKCNDAGRLLETMSIAIKTKEIDIFVEKAYQQGLLLHKIASKAEYYHFKIHPDNNVPGIPLSPPSIEIDDTLV